MNVASLVPTEQVGLEPPSMQGCDHIGVSSPGSLCLCKLTRHNLAGVDCYLAPTRRCTAACQGALVVVYRLHLQDMRQNILLSFKPYICMPSAVMLQGDDKRNVPTHKGSCNRDMHTCMLIRNKLL